MSKTFRDYITLIEGNSTLILTEYDRSITAKNSGERLLKKYTQEVGVQVVDPADQEEVLDNLLAKFEAVDPTKNKQYVQWLIKVYLGNPNLKVDTLLTPTTGEHLSKYFTLTQKKQIPAPNNNIVNIKTLDDLATIVGTQEIKQRPEKDKGESIEYYSDKDVRVVIPKDQAAACYYGKGTAPWCTAKTKGDNSFDQYNKQGPLYIIMPKNPSYPGEKYQLHFQSREYKNENNADVPIFSILVKYPGLQSKLASQLTGAEVNMADLQKFTAISEAISKSLTKWTNSILDEVNDYFLDNRLSNYVGRVQFMEALGNALRTDQQNLANYLAGEIYEAGGVNEAVVSKAIAIWLSNQPIMKQYKISDKDNQWYYDFEDAMVEGLMESILPMLTMDIPRVLRNFATST